jgi:hypothetical protein
MSCQPRTWTCYPNCNPCYTTCYTACQPACTQVCPAPCPAPQCPPVSYITNAATPTNIPSGGTVIPVGTTIGTGITTVPAGTVTVINGYTGAPSTNSGGVIANNGFFTIPVAGRYQVSADVCFDTVATTLASDLREVTIYKVDNATGLVTLQAIDSRVPIATVPTCVNIATTVDFAANDRVFIAARQTNGAAAIIPTVALVGRVSITRN